MKLKESFVTYGSGSETVLIPTPEASFSGIVRGNNTFGFILECLKEELTEAELEAKMKEKYKNAEPDMLESDIKKTLDGLRQIGALDE